MRLDWTAERCAAELVRHLPTQKDKRAGLLPPLAEARQLGRTIGQAVGRQAMLDGQAQVANAEALGRELHADLRAVRTQKPVKEGEWRWSGADISRKCSSHYLPYSD